ncbi:MAG: hypothetical protein JSU90_02735, partial [Nitrospiraceae bacterium]
IKKIGLFISAPVLFLLMLIAGPDPALAVNSGSVQEVRGELSLKQTNVYLIPALRQGQILHVFMEDPADILDPLVMLLKPEISVEAVRKEYLLPLENALSAGGDPIVSPAETFEKISLIWNDDYEGRYRAAFQYTIQQKGDYRLLIRSTFGRETAGRFRLLVGVNAPSVLKGTAKPAGKPFVSTEKGDETGGKTISSATGTISKGRDFKLHFLHDIPAGETLYVYAEATSGDLRPVITLLDLSDKPLETSNYSGQESRVSMKYLFEQSAQDVKIKISGLQPDGTDAEGDYRLLVGSGAPEVMLGTGVDTARPALKRPIPVKIGIKLHQIAGVDQKNENFTVVATLFMKWHETSLAFNPNDVGKRVKLYMGDELIRARTEDSMIWPEFNIFNQQGNRWTQSKAAVIFPNGSALYLERFTTTLQAPDFDFRKFPFDAQQFFIRVDSLLPEWEVLFELMEGYSEVGQQLGEEEWLVTSFDPSISEAETAGRPVSRFNFRFEARRHLEYYIFRILLPILIILLVSWVVFFLKDYSKRIDVAGGNLLLFIAFNFTISSDLPRLGYLTFMDAIMISAFVVTALVLILSVFLKRIAEAGREELALKIDRYVLRWLYPLAYIGAVAVVTFLFG